MYAWQKRLTYVTYEKQSGDMKNLLGLSMSFNSVETDNETMIKKLFPFYGDIKLLISIGKSNSMKNLKYPNGTLSCYESQNLSKLCKK